ncbi:YjcZ family sporulation protein [Bacillus sp. CGMCC 1.16541]|uniref:YjcZ family sporulation protein n=1 Tax=Bacillus sp. CGMCC 1.16541 TaxID=2185143 RepID=UPI000D73C5CD|nr:YjcZ family sporulation protein [Bacillus sp. CGMCC 1.16541]
MYNYGFDQSCGHQMMPVGGYDACCPVMPVGGYAAPSCGIGHSFTLIVVLFILLIIIGCSYTYDC